MKKNELYLEGELYLSLEAVAEVYEIQVTWLRAAYDAGLFGKRVDVDATACIAAIQMDRVSTVVRLHVLGLDLDTIQLALEQ